MRGDNAQGKRKKEKKSMYDAIKSNTEQKRNDISVWARSQGYYESIETEGLPIRILFRKAELQPDMFGEAKSIDERFEVLVGLDTEFRLDGMRRKTVKEVKKLLDEAAGLANAYINAFLMQEHYENCMIAESILNFNEEEDDGKSAV